MKVLDCAGGSAWWHISLGGLEGYVASRYTVENGAIDITTLPAPAPVPTPAPVCTDTYYWTTQAVNLRAAASASSKIKIVVPSGVKLTALDCDGQPNWIHSMYNGMQGYVSAKYTAQQLSDTGLMPAPAPVGIAPYTAPMGTAMISQ
jgi:uncharacterized protein YraI